MAAILKASHVLGAGADGVEKHGGAEIYKVRTLEADFSVTTNALGPVPSAVRAVGELFAVKEIGDCVTGCHAVANYPNPKATELTEQVARFLRPVSPEGVAERLVFGNGASELIDLLGRAGPPGNGFCLMPKSDVQYKEYERACKNSKRTLVDNATEAAMIMVVNPTNPTGRFMEQQELEAWIESSAKAGSWVVVDESMIFWANVDWHSKGVSDAFIGRMLERDVHVFINHSWTKIFSCTGMRIGSTLCPTAADRQKLQDIQVPWSMTVFASTFLKTAIEDTEYLRQTWELTPIWREHMVTKLQQLFPNWTLNGQPWLSWIWVDTHDVEMARRVYEASIACGCPLRTGAYGYERPSFVRFAVRRPTDFEKLYKALSAVAEAGSKD